MQTKYQKLYDNEKNKEKQHATPPLPRQKLLRDK